MSNYPVTLTIPPDQAAQPGLAVVNRQWRRLDDGSIEAVFNDTEELRLCLDVTRYLREDAKEHDEQNEN